MSTKAELIQINTRLQIDLDVAKSNTLHGSTVREISTELLERLSMMQDESQAEAEELGGKLEKLESAYEAIDNADDRIRELGE